MSHRVAPAHAVEPALRIACVLTPRRLVADTPGAMNLIRFVRMSEALARRGHEVHLVSAAPTGLASTGLLREVMADAVRWTDYDVVKTVLHSGFVALDRWGGSDHPFIVSNLGSVVGREDTDGVYFYGTVREDLWHWQQQVARRSRVVSLHTTQNADLYRRMHGTRPTLMVPGGVDAVVPAPGPDPYAALGVTEPVALFAGNIYSRDRQAEVNLFWQDRLNRLGRALRRRRVRLVAMGPGAIDHLDPACVTHVGVIDFRAFWDWQWHARVGIVLAQGAVQDNESSKIYYYLRTGLPVVSDASVPNVGLITETGHGATVPFHPYDLEAFADAAAGFAAHAPDPRGVIAHMTEHHSWDARAARYAPILASARDIALRA